MFAPNLDRDLERELDELQHNLSHVGPQGFRSPHTRTFFERKLRLLDAEAALLNGQAACHNIRAAMPQPRG